MGRPMSMTTAHTPTYGLGSFPLPPDFVGICRAPRCRSHATRRIAWLHKAEVLTAEFCANCNATADLPLFRFECFK